MHFRVFSLGQCKERVIFWGVLKFQKKIGVLEIPDSFLGRTVDAGPKPTYEEKSESTPPPPLGVDPVHLFLATGG